MLDGKTADWLTPQAVSSLNSWVPTPGDHVCGPTGSGTVKCWGRNDFGQLGYATTSTCPDGKACGLTPTDVPGIAFSAGNDVGTIFVGRTHTCTHPPAYSIGGGFDAGADAIVINPDVSCWGANDKGQLGDGTTTSRATPQKAIGDVVWLVGNGDSMCAGKTTGEILCWGANDYGQLGDGTTTNRLTPTPMPNLAGKGVGALGTRHGCTAGPSGVSCWGANDSGQLGYTTTETCHGVPCSTTPQAVPGTMGIDRIAVGDAHTCGMRTADSSVMCWGANDHGQLGDGTTTARPSPTPVVLP
jgi:alpha-tubulin suppressor-like RCC1 family protein